MCTWEKVPLFGIRLMPYIFMCFQIKGDLNTLKQFVVDYHTDYGYDTTQDWSYSWTFSKALLFTLTIMTTIGNFIHTHTHSLFPIPVVPNHYCRNHKCSPQKSTLRKKNWIFFKFGDLVVTLNENHWISILFNIIEI